MLEAELFTQALQQAAFLFHFFFFLRAVCAFDLFFGNEAALFELLYLSRHQGGEEEATDAIVGIGGFFEEGLDVDRMSLRAGGEAQGFGTSVSAKRLRETDQAVIGLIVNILAAIHIRLPQAFEEPQVKLQFACIIGNVFTVGRDPDPGIKTGYGFAWVVDIHQPFTRLDPGNIALVRGTDNHVIAAADMIKQFACIAAWRSIRGAVVGWCRRCSRGRRRRRAVASKELLQPRNGVAIVGITQIQGGETVLL